jgi:hypothetical protein
MKASDALSKARSTLDVKELTYYVIAMPWFRKVAKILDVLSPPKGASFPTFTSSWKEDIGPIVNAPLTPSEFKRNPPRPFLHELQKKSLLKPNHSAENGDHSASDTEPMKVGLHHRHEIDYVLVGSNVWLLLSQKFGHDVELSVPCEYVPRNLVSNASATSVRIRVNESESIYIPSTGRFPYEKYFAQAEDASSSSSSALLQSPPDVVSPDDDEPTMTADTFKSDDEDNDLVSRLFAH